MPILSMLGNDVFSPVNVDGSPRSVINQSVQRWATEVERYLDALGAGSVDPGDLPPGWLKATNTGAGTPNAIEATTPLPVSAAALIVLNIVVTNTGSPVTVRFNGAGTAYRIRTRSGEDVAVGGLTPGIVFGFIDGTDFWLANDESIAALIYEARDEAEAAAAGAESARDAAEGYRDQAAGFVNDIVSEKEVPIFATKDGMASINVPVGISSIIVLGGAAIDDGQGGKYDRRSTEPSFGDYFPSADGGWWVRDLPTNLTTRDFGFEAWGRHIDTGENMRITLQNLLGESKERRLVFGAEYLNQVVVVDGGDDEVFHLNNSGGLITFDLTTIGFGKPYFFLNGTTSTTDLDPGALGGWNGIGTSGQSLRFGPREGCIIVRYSNAGFYVLANRSVPLTGLDGARRYWECPNATFEYRGRTTLTASTTTNIQLPAIFGGQTTDNVFVICSLTKSGTADLSCQAPIRKRGSDTAGTAGVTGPSFAIYNPNATTIEVEFIISNLIKTA